MRVLFILLLVLWPDISHAAFRIVAPKCVSAGQSITIAGGGFTARPSGEIQVATRPRPLKLRVQSWSARQVRVALPRTGLKAGDTLDVIWIAAGAARKLLGRIAICTNTPPNRTRASRDVVPSPDGSPEYIVFVATGQNQTAIRSLQAQGATLLRTRSLPQLGRTLLLFSFPGNLSLNQAQTVLRRAAPSATVDLHHIYGFAAGPRLYAAAMIGDDPGHSCRLRRAVRVGLIDGPVNRSHPALAGVSVIRMPVLASGERAAKADHGTAVAGLIAGQPSGGPLMGFAAGAQIFAAEAFANTRGREGARLENVAAGIDWLLGKGVRIVNMSMSGSTNSTFASILSLARKKGMVIVAAAGNDSTSKPRFPAASEDTIAITAVDAAGRVYSKANTGKHIEFSAPGVDIFVAKGGGGGYRSGTSYAAPIVTALVARQAARGGISLNKIRNHLRRNVLDLGAAGRDSRFGYGLVQTGGC